VDHYNRFGACFAKTTYSADSEPIMTVYQDVNGQQVLLENHVTGDILLTLPGQSMRYFANKVEFITFFLQDLEIDTSQLIFNTLATPFLVSFHYP
ncbi:accessory Sec system glycosylation chaperone GtfB, partial [Streptococcus pneumoniae]|nr:accessory Sec system glycosylation chaperone GtfB [Streptococcus pneumoniae]